MEYREFVEQVREMLAEEFGEGFTVSTFEVKKNNSVKKTGLTIKREDQRVAPTFYLEELFEQYKEGRDLKDIRDGIVKMYAMHDGSGIDVDSFSNFEWVKERLFCKLVNTEKNKDRLGDIPYTECMDLMLMYGVLVEIRGGAVGSITITNEHLKMWGVTKDDIHELAVENTQKMFPAKISTMAEILREMGVPDCFEPGPSVPMYVMSNKDKVNGACTMMYKQSLKELSDKIESDLYILPSSIHEVLLVPKNEIKYADELKQMIQEVNDTQVEPEEILSYSLYEYSRETGEIGKVA